MADKAIGLFGKGTKTKNINELKKMYDKVLKDPTKSNISELYTKVYGEKLDINEINEVRSASIKLRNGIYQLEDGQTLEKEVYVSIEEIQ